MILFRSYIIPSLFFLILIALLSDRQTASGASGLLQTKKDRQSNSQSKKLETNQVTSTNVPATDRSSLSVRKALLGHWVSEEHETHYYYSETKLISVYAGRAHIIPYTIDEIDEKERKVRIRITEKHAEVLTFSTDKREIASLGDYGIIKAETPIMWKYVDNSQASISEILEKAKMRGMKLEVITSPERPILIVGDSRKKVYFPSNCSNYEEIPLEKRIYFSSIKDAQKAAYKGVKTCP
jgi:hypothetical protein